MLEVPAKFAEMITEQFRVQCTYAEKGCKEAIPFKVGIIYKVAKNVGWRNSHPRNILMVFYIRSSLITIHKNKNNHRIQISL